MHVLVTLYTYKKFNNRLCYLVQSKNVITALGNNHQNDYKMKIHPELKKFLRSIF